MTQFNVCALLLASPAHVFCMQLAIISVSQEHLTNFDTNWACMAAEVDFRLVISEVDGLFYLCGRKQRRKMTCIGF